MGKEYQTYVTRSCQEVNTRRSRSELVRLDAFLHGSHPEATRRCPNKQAAPPHPPPPPQLSQLLDLGSAGKRGKQVGNHFNIGISSHRRPSLRDEKGPVGRPHDEVPALPPSPLLLREGGGRAGGGGGGGGPGVAAEDLVLEVGGGARGVPGAVAEGARGGGRRHLV